MKTMSNGASAEDTDLVASAIVSGMGNSLNVRQSLRSILKKIKTNLFKNK